MTQLTAQNLEVYAEALRAIGRNGSDTPDPFGLRLEKGINALVLKVKLAELSYAFIETHYHDRLNRVTTQYLEPSGTEFSWEISFLYGWSNTLQLNLSCNTIREAYVLIRVLAAEGLAVKATPDKESSGTIKRWEFFPRDVKEDETTVRLHLAVTAKRCRQVKVGEETRTIPIYETDCSWGEEPELQAGEGY